jgi:hypothetical protein
MVMADDRRACEVAMRGCGLPPERAGMVLIQDTLHLDRLWASPVLADAVAAAPHLVVQGTVPLEFDGRGNIVSPWLLE